MKYSSSAAHTSIGRRSVWVRVLFTSGLVLASVSADAGEKANKPGEAATQVSASQSPRVAALSLQPQKTETPTVGPSEVLRASRIRLPIRPSHRLTDKRRLQETPTVKPLFQMKHVERIRLRIWGKPDFNGEYAIESNGEFSIQGIGRVFVGDMSTRELEGMLNTRLGALLRTSITSAVEVIKFRSHMIIGSVSNTGAAEWRPGLTVIQAVSMAGGLIRPRNASGLSESSLSVAQARSNLEFALAQSGRLVAERDKLKSVSQTKSFSRLRRLLVSMGREKAYARSVRAEDERRQIQRNLLESQIAGFARLREIAEHELTATLKRQKSLRAQLENSIKLLKSFEFLRSKQLIGKQRLLEQRNAVLRIKVLLDSTVSIAIDRARQQVASFTQQIDMANQVYRTKNDTDLINVQQRIAQYQLVVNASGMRRGIREVGQKAGSFAQISYHLARSGKSGVAIVNANLFSRVLPGDVVIVTRGPRSSKIVVSDANNGDNRPLAVAQRILSASSRIGPARRRRR